MGTLLGILAIGACVGVLWLVQTGIGKSVNAVDRKVRSGTHQEGTQQVWTGLEVTSPAPVAETLDAVVRSVNAHASAPALVAGLFLKSRGEDWVAFALGNKLDEHMVSVLQLVPVESGCTGTFTVTAWKSSGADVAGRNELPKLRERIGQAVRGLGGSTVEVKENPA